MENSKNDLEEFFKEMLYIKSKINESKVFSQSKVNSTYDSEGAATYVIVVIAWYFLGVVSFVTWQMSKKKVPNDYKTELLSQGLEDQVKTKLILGF